MLKLFTCVLFLLITTDDVRCSCSSCEYSFNPELPGWIALHRIPATWEEAFLRYHFEDYHLNEHTDSCYKLHRDRHTWSRANMICAAEGEYLVILNDAEEAKHVKNMFPNQYHNYQSQQMYIGLRAWSKDRVWLTNHGQSVDNVYNAWDSEQPDNQAGKEYCGALISNGAPDAADMLLNDISCESTAIFVCEKDPKRIMFDLLSNE